VVSRGFTCDMGLISFVDIDAKMFKMAASQFVLDAKLHVDYL
jgi:hypothetical protein